MQNSNLIFRFGFFSLLTFAVLSVVSLTIGTANISFSDILACISGGEVDEMKKVILFQMRLPRLVMGLIVGMLLATSGVVVQSVFLNPVADPYIIGIASAATFGAVVAYLLKLPDIFYGVFAFLCAAGLSIVIFKL
ncbi:MAG: iron chelate uptake ABC transporter family permease subunit, partial [Campylobacter sp.]|nr:iron chelate uptake ABC transporter family permease subunit [Campylobacter sp.]